MTVRTGGASRYAAAAAVGVLLLARCGGAPPAADPIASQPTFTHDIAPIVFRNCAPCHHPGGAGPFSLLTYDDVTRRARDIARVVDARYMPPWLPEPGHGDFASARRLDEGEVRAILRWIEQGAAEGDAADLPAAPAFRDGWQLGEPDLVLRMSEAYTLPAGGEDVFRNFVVPAGVEETRFVKAIEILPGNPRIVHHANVLIDRTGASRRRDRQDPAPGFEGMDVDMEAERFEPESHFLFWKPGTVPYAEPDDMAWPLEKGTDLVLNMHLQPSGRPEMVQAAIGLYFAERPPSRFPMLIQLEHDGAIDIPPGRADFAIADAFVLPLDVQVLAVYPHAHYLGRTVEGIAELPDGTRRPLIRIADWDLAWQAVYRYREPLALPRGTTLTMRWRYDNSAGNPRNPHHPPARVRAGNRASDEMGHLWIQILPASREDLPALQEALMRRRLEKYPRDFTAHANLGALLLTRGLLEPSIAHLREAAAIRPDAPVARNTLGAALRTAGRLDAAMAEFRAAVRLDPDHASGRYNLGAALLAAGRPQEAAEQFRHALRLQPEDAEAENDLGSALALQGNLQGAARHFARAAAIDPAHPYAHANLGHALVRQGQPAAAIPHYERALAIRPDADLCNDLGAVLAQTGRRAEAIARFEQALRLDPSHAGARANLDRLRQ